MSNIANRIKSHLPGHHETHNTPVHSSTPHYPNSTVDRSTMPSTVLPGAAPLAHTYHQENTEKGLHNSVVHKKEDHFEGRKGHVEETIIQKETVITEPIKQKKIEKSLERSTPIPPPVAVPMTHMNVAPEIQRTVIEKPIIVKERFLPEEKIEIQPVIHRDREQREVHEVIQPIKEREVMATKVVNATLANQIRAPIVENDASFQVKMRESNSRYASSTEYGALRSETIERPAIIEEHIHRTIVEEVQPVLYKETVVPVLIKETQPIYEKIVEAPIIINEERAVRELGTRFVQTTLSDQRGMEHMGFQNVVYSGQNLGTNHPNQHHQQQQFASGSNLNQYSTQQQQFVSDTNQQQFVSGNNQQQFVSGTTQHQFQTNQQQFPSGFNNSLQGGNVEKIYEKKVEIYEKKNPLQPNVSSTRLV